MEREFLEQCLVMLCVYDEVIDQGKLSMITVKMLFLQKYCLQCLYEGLTDDILTAIQATEGFTDITYN